MFIGIQCLQMNDWRTGLEVGLNNWQGIQPTSRTALLRRLTNGAVVTCGASTKLPTALLLVGVTLQDWVGGPGLATEEKMANMSG